MVRMKGRRQVVVFMVVLMFLGVMIGRCLLHLEEKIWREEGRGGGRHAIAGHWPHQRRWARSMGVFERERERERPKRTWKYNRTVVVVERKGKNGNYN